MSYGRGVRAAKTRLVDGLDSVADPRVMAKDIDRMIARENDKEIGAIGQELVHSRVLGHAGAEADPYYRRPAGVREIKTAAMGRSYPEDRYQWAFARRCRRLPGSRRRRGRTLRVAVLKVHRHLRWVEVAGLSRRLFVCQNSRCPPNPAAFATSSPTFPRSTRTGTQGVLRKFARSASSYEEGGGCRGPSWR